MHDLECTSGVRHKTFQLLPINLKHEKIIQNRPFHCLYLCFKHGFCIKGLALGQPWRWFQRSGQPAGDHQ